MSITTNTAITLARRPVGPPQADDFRYTQTEIGAVGDGEVLCRTVYLSLDPYMRGRMNEGPSYVPPAGLREVMPGGAVSQVVESRYESLASGDFVMGYTGWQEYSVSPGAHLRKLDPDVAPISTALGVLGMPGMTAYVGLDEIGQPAAGETLVVTAATGAVGSVVGQIGKIKGCRVVGIAGSEEKCRYAQEELGFDACVSYRQADFADSLKEACPDGVDVYWENVGGASFFAALGLLNDHARIPLCGMISYYNLTELPQVPDPTPRILRTLLVRRVKLSGFIVFDHQAREQEFLREMGSWVRDNRVRYREDIVDGLDNAVDAFTGLLQGRNFGKQLIRVSPDPTRG